MSKYDDCKSCGGPKLEESRQCGRCRYSAGYRKSTAWTAAEEQVVVEHPDWTAAEIGAQIGRTAQAVKNHQYRMRQQGRLPAVSPPQQDEDQERLRLTDRLYRWYWNDRLSLSEIAKRVDRPRRTVAEWFKQLRIPTRTRKQGMSVRWRRDPDPSHGVPLKDRSYLPTSRYFDLIHERRKEKGLTVHGLLREIGVSWETVFGDHRPRPEYVVRLADVLEIDRALLLDAAGYPEPSPARWRMLEALARGMTRQELSLGLGVTKGCLCRWLKNFDSPLSLDSIYNIHAFLGLTKAEKDAEIGTYYAGEKLRRSRQSTTLIERHYPAWIDPEESKARMKAVWDDPQKRREHIRLIREGMEKRKIHIDKEWLREQLDQGLSLAKIGEKVGVSGETVRQRSIEYDLREGETRPQRRRRQKRTMQMNKGHQQHAANRREVAKQILAGMDDGNLLRLSVRKFEQLIANEDPNGKGLTKSVAEEMLRAAKAMARTRLTIAS